MTTQLKCQKLIAASCCIFLSMVVVTTKVSAQQQDLFSFRSTSAPGGPFIYWAGANDHTCASQDWHCVGKASLYLPTITGHYPAATFRQVPGLVGDGTISFRTSTDRDWYITHNGSEVSIIRDTGTASFRERASFLPIPVGSVGENFFSYAAFTDRGSFLSRSGKQLIMAASDNTDQFREDSKFIRVEPLWDGSPWEPSATSHEGSKILHHIARSICNLNPAPLTSEIDGTYSTDHLFDTYSAGIQHVQGIAQLSDGRYALSHDTRDGRNESLLIFENGFNDTVMIRAGNGNHPGAIQAAGQIVAVPIKGGELNGKSEIIFMDASNRAQPIELTHLKIPLTLGSLNAVGFAYHYALQRHFVIANFNGTYSKGNNYIYRGTKSSIFASGFKFEKVGEVKVFGSQGGTQLLYENNDGGNMYLVALYRTELKEDQLGLEKITFSRLEGLEKTGDNLSISAVEENTKVLSDSGGRYDYGAGFRWGGTIAVQGNTLEAVSVARTLAHSPFAQYAKIEKWVQQRSPPKTDCLNPIL